MPTDGSADLVLKEEWGNRTPRTQIVAIAKHGSVDGNELRARFDGCVATEG